MVRGRGSLALIQFLQHTLPTPIAAFLGSRILSFVLRLSGAEHLDLECKVTTRIGADYFEVFSLVLQHVQQESFDAFIHRFIHTFTLCCRDFITSPFSV